MKKVSNRFSFGGNINWTLVCRYKVYRLVRRERRGIIVYLPMKYHLGISRLAPARRNSDNSSLSLPIIDGDKNWTHTHSNENPNHFLRWMYTHARELTPRLYILGCDLFRCNLTQKGKIKFLKLLLYFPGISGILSYLLPFYLVV